MKTTTSNEFLMIPVTPDELMDEFEKRLLKALSAFKESEERQGLLTIREVCALLRVSKGTLASYTKKGLIPQEQIKGTSGIRYRKGVVLDSLQTIKKYKMPRE